MNRPTRMTFLTLCRAIPQIAAQFQRTIPEEFWTIADGATNAVDVCCPCGHTPTVPCMQPTSCDCDRWFLNTGDVVRVARYPTADTAEV